MFELEMHRSDTSIGIGTDVKKKSRSLVQMHRFDIGIGIDIENYWLGIGDNVTDRTGADRCLF